MMAKAAGGSGRRDGVPPRKAEDFPVLTRVRACAKTDGGECSHPPFEQGRSSQATPSAWPA